MEQTEKALVLRVGRFRETDMWVAYLSPSQGVTRAFAFGASRSRRRFVGCLDPLNLVLFTLEPSTRPNQGHKLSEGSLIHGFPGLRRDRLVLASAGHCLKFVEAVQIGPQGARKSFDLTLATLYGLEEGSVPPAAAPLFFKTRSVWDHGYAPELQECAGCGLPLAEIREPWFLVDKGRVACAGCRPAEGPMLRTSAGALKTLDWIGQAEPQDWRRLGLEPVVHRQCGEVLDAYVAWHLGLVWEEGRFRKT